MYTTLLAHLYRGLDGVLLFVSPYKYLPAVIHAPFYRRSVGLIMIEDVVDTKYVCTYASICASESTLPQRKLRRVPKSPARCSIFSHWWISKKRTLSIARLSCIDSESPYAKP